MLAAGVAIRIISSPRRRTRATFARHLLGDGRAGPRRIVDQKEETC
jgi:hypothetical protein